jgi:peptidoglycan hydrolase-like protein with peptidoglycan-binding domain
MVKFRHTASAALLTAAVGLFGGPAAHATIPVLNLANPSSPSMSGGSAPRAASAGMQWAAFPDGKLVREVQRALDADGAHLRVDGLLGQRTMTALLNYQSRHGLEPTGRIDRATEQSLRIM